MMKHLRITVDGKIYDVLVEDLTDDSGGTLYPAPGTMAAAQAPRAATVAPPPRLQPPHQQQRAAAAMVTNWRRLVVSSSRSASRSAMR